MKEKIKIGLVGYGIVGNGVIKIINSNRAALEKRVGARIDIAAVCDIRRIRVKGAKYYKRYKDLIARRDIDIIVELVGGYEPARTLILEALNAGKHVVTANKAVLAKYWDEIFSAAHQNGCLTYFEAAVGAGIPVIEGLNEGLAANKINKIVGILNGTTNYILSEMTKKGVSFNTALDHARKAGFAEADPSFDIDGIDTAHKLAVLASLAYSSWIKLEDISVSGIKQVSADDVKFAKEEFDYVIKLLGYAIAGKNGMELSVEPCMISGDDNFANVDGENNAILFSGDATGDVIFYGKGAGQLPAASAVVSDIIFLARQIANGTAGQVPYVTYDPGKHPNIIPEDNTQSRYYLKFTTLDKPGVLSRISGILGKHGVSIASVYQKPPIKKRRKGVPIIMITHKTKYGNLAKAMSEIDKLSMAMSKSVKYKIFE
ncbi:MAG: homoserine dehydrogenase [Elusimicrobiota bacterium]